MKKKKKDPKNYLTPRTVLKSNQKIAKKKKKKKETKSL